jgi:hypothetical protein
MGLRVYLVVAPLFYTDWRTSYLPFHTITTEKGVLVCSLSHSYNQLQIKCVTPLAQFRDIHSAARSS